jgi:hypothetical protein
VQRLLLRVVAVSLLLAIYSVNSLAGTGEVARSARPFLLHVEILSSTLRVRVPEALTNPGQSDSSALIGGPHCDVETLEVRVMRSFRGRLAPHTKVVRPLPTSCRSTLGLGVSVVLLGEVRDDVAHVSAAFGTELVDGRLAVVEGAYDLQTILGAPSVLSEAREPVVRDYPTIHGEFDYRQLATRGVVRFKRTETDLNRLCTTCASPDIADAFEVAYLKVVFLDSLANL